MKPYKIMLMLIFTAGLLAAAGCMQEQPKSPEITQPPPDLVNVSIVSDNPRYSRMLSSSPGMGLSPKIEESESKNNFSYRWTTDYGTFLSWTSPDFRVLSLGPDAVVTHPKVYWNYRNLSEGQSRPVAHISLKLIDPSTGATRGYATRTIRWAEGDIAEIQ